ncbi:MAG: vanadium-dependent haloperoxidase [Acidobacteriota bacterium]|nr:vanadium-dependent haloperoxidase [Acidobacteriota bacterium]
MKVKTVQTRSAKSPSRRKFIGQVGVTGAVTIAAGVIGVEPLLGTRGSIAVAAPGELGNQRQEDQGHGENDRASECLKIRKDAAQAGFKATPPNLQHPTNNDEALYANKAASYSKGLPHNSDGTVDLVAFQAMVRALDSERPAHFDSIPLGGSRKLTNPQAGVAFDMEGPDSHALVQLPAPAFASREEAAEIAENYWMALLRDVPFNNYGSHPTAAAAGADLTNFGTDFKGPKNTLGAVTPEFLFRGLTPGDKVGPYISQYFYLPCLFGANVVDQQIITAAPVSTAGNGGAGLGRDYMTAFSDWLNIQNGLNPVSGDVADPTRRYMRMGRDIGQWVHIDVLFQGYFQAFLVLAGMGAPFDDGNPYNGNPTQAGFGTFGGPHIATLLCEVSTRCLKAVWYQKWFVHRRLRPEAFAGRIEYNRTHPGAFNVHPSINSSTALAAIKQHNEQFNGAGNGTYLLPMAFPEGSPTHPAYGAGHATVAGACVTILKAWFKESTPISSLTTPMQPTPNGFALEAYAGADAGQMTVGGELNKIASNVAIGRDIAGVHWRSDATESLKLGEHLAIGILRDQRACYNENFGGFSLTKFDGTTVTV